MADLKPLIATTDLKTARLHAERKPLRPYAVRYQDGFDALFILLVEPRQEVITHYVDDHVALLYELESKEIVGLQVEAFKRSFLPQHALVQQVWQLNDVAGHLEDFGDLFAAFEALKPEVTREVIRAAQDVLGAAGRDLMVAVG